MRRSEPLFRIDRLQRRRLLVELARIGRAEQRLIDNRNFLDAAHGALELKAFAFREAPLPAALGLVRERVETPGDVLRSGRGFLLVGEDVRMKHAGDRRLLDHLAIVAAVQSEQDAANEARLFDQGSQVVAGALLAVREAQHGIVEPGVDEKVFQRALVLEVLLGLAARDLVERRLRDKEVAAVDDLAHLPVEKGQQQGADVRAVDIGVRHDDDLMVAQLID